MEGPHSWPQHGVTPGKTNFLPDATGPASGIEVDWYHPGVDPSRFLLGRDGLFFDRVIDTGDGRYDVPASVTIDGDQQWERRDVAGVAVGVTEEAVLVVDRSEVRGLDHSTGADVWNVSLPSAVQRAPTLADDELLLPSEDGIVAVDLTARNDRWETEHAPMEAHEDPTWVTPAVGDEVIVTLDRDQAEGAPAVYGIARQSGELEWRLELAGDRRFAVQDHPVISEDQAFVLTRNEAAHLHAIDVEEGTLTWTCELPGYTLTAPAIGHGTLVIVVGSPNGDRTIAGVDGQRGEIRWTHELPTVYQTDLPAMLGEYAYVVVGEYLVAIHVEDGTIAWEFSMVEWAADRGDTAATYRNLWNAPLGPIAIEDRMFIWGAGGRGTFSFRSA